MEDLSDSARPMEAVRIQGRYRPGADSFLRVQRWEGGKWLAFPVPTKTDQSGHFTTYIELGQPGRYTLRVIEGEEREAEPTVTANPAAVQLAHPPLSQQGQRLQRHHPRLPLGLA